MAKAGLGLLLILLGGLAGQARAADAVPFFKADPRPVMVGPLPLFQPAPRPVMYGPVLPDPAAPECGIDDQPCIERHDARVLSLAGASHARQECAESTHPESCYDAYDMISGDFVPKSDPILSDPCAWVVLVDHNLATLSSKKLGLTKRVFNRGWKARTFIGTCNVKTIAPEQPVAFIPMPAWTVRKGQPAQTAAAAPAPRVVTVIPVPVNAPGPTPPAASAPTAPASSRPAAPAASIPTAPAAPAPSSPTPTTPPAVQPPLAPPTPIAGPPGTTQPPPFAHPPAVSDAQNGPAPR